MLKQSAKKLAKRCGIEILRSPHAYASHHALAGLLQQQQINLVLDVGANIGHFGEDLRALGYSGRIISFEPLSAAHAQLCKRAAHDPHWTVADRTAIGDNAGSVTIHVASNSESSSLLDMLPAHADAAPDSAYIDTETVPLNPLDDLYSPTPEDRILLKIDVQGYERQVLAGAQRILQSCQAISSEMSLVPLYEGQTLARAMWDLLAEKEFEPWSLEPLFRDPRTGRLLQFDALFRRRSIALSE